MLTAGDAEVGLVAAPPPLAGLGDLQVQTVETQRFVLLGVDAGALPPGDPVEPADLAGYPLIVGQEGTGMRRVAEDVRRRAAGSRFAVEVEHREAVLPLVLAGVGVAVVSESWRELAEAAGAAVRDLACADALEVALVHRPARLSPAAIAFLTVAGEVTDPPIDRQSLSAQQ